MKKNVITKLLLGAAIFISPALVAQSNFTIDASQTLSTFQFVDSEANVDKSYSGNYSGAYNLGYRYIHEKGIIVRTGIGMRTGGATMVYDGINYNWSLQYATFNLGGGYMYGDGLFKPYLTVAGYFGYLLKANQTVNNEDFDIINIGEIQKIDYGVIGSLGTQITLSDEISAYTEFSYLRGLGNLETNETGQKSSNISYMLSLGMSFSINTSK
ncbi:MAG: outer membrane beta-barrel protein [Flavobacteriales bacterium]|nr:outer membrane beta-barrel protein [Flavobacteriales bacterium]